MPIHPCGSVVDAVRSCYRTKMRFSPDTDLVEVRWYLSPAGAPFLPRPTCFNSLNWATDGERDSDTGLAGEVPGEPRPWSNGNTAGISRMGFKGSAGPDDYWLNGAPSPVWLPLELTSEGIPVACGGPPPPLPCYGPGLPATLYCRITRLTGGCFDLDGDLEFTQTSSTTWAATIEIGGGEWVWELECRVVEWSINAYFDGFPRGSTQYPLVTVDPFVLDAGATVGGVPGVCDGGTFDLVFKTTPFV